MKVKKIYCKAILVLLIFYEIFLSIKREDLGLSTNFNNQIIYNSRFTSSPSGFKFKGV